MALRRYRAQIADAVVHALADCFHYKEDVASFLIRCGVPATRVQAHEFTRHGPPKFVSAKALVDELAADPTVGTPLLARIIDGLLAEDLDFPRLKKLENGDRRVEKARRAILKLQDQTGTDTLTARREKARAEEIGEGRRHAELVRRRAEMLSSLHATFMKLFGSSSPQQRGRAFEQMLQELFELFDLSPRGSLRPPGEEIDGSIIFDGQHILVEAKWEKNPIETGPIAIFRQKIEDKLKTTLGLYVSMSGYSPNAVQKAGGSGARSMILMDGLELVPVLEGHVDLRDLLARKIRYAHETGRALFKPFSGQ